MTPRTGVMVALAGFALTVLCTVPLYLMPNLDASRDDAILGIVLLGLGAVLGATVMVIGLTLSGVTAFTKQRAHRS